MESSTHESVLSVDTQKWLDAQAFESRCWVVDNQKNSRLQVVMKFLRALKKSPRHFFELLTFRDFYAGDDWNFWWKEKFDEYRVLPAHLHKALEVGSGPYTNIRLISKLKRIDEIHCVDPLMELYKSFKLNWLAEMVKKGRVHAHTGKGESLDFPNDSFDLVVCNNVLDHVQDASACLSEIHRVLKPGGWFVFGQDLSNKEDIERQHREDRGYVGHPIKLNEKTLDTLLSDNYDIKLKKILPREAGRNPRHHCGTYLSIGVKHSK
ncbi:MAG: class I SAM-dependent methyltransferase [Candidatus Pacebacteria bacterium]|nr:class I SAM-dependent methyltransferase [Candidatus Paceibacterota bacterium]